MDPLGAPTVEANANILLHLRRQELGMCVLRANAHLLLARVRQAFSARLTLRAPEQAPIGAGPEGGESAFACLADGAYWRSDPLTGYFQRGERAACDQRARARGRMRHYAGCPASKSV